MKFIMNSKKLVLALVLVIALGSLAGCGAGKEEPSNEEQTDTGSGNELSGTVEVVGSTSVTPVAEKLGEVFMKEYKEVKINVQGIGSTAGVKAANDEIADVGMASRNLKEGEKEWELDEHVIAYDGIAVVAHPSNGVSELDKDTITKIFKGEITNWKEVGGEDKEIVVVSREAGSGTRGAFEGIMNLQEKNDKGKKVSVVIEDALIAEGNGAVRANIAKKENAIGYISLAYMNDTVKGFKIDGAEPTVENIVAGDYKVSRPFLMLTKGELSKAAKAYLDFIMSDKGQEIVAEKLIPVNSSDSEVKDFKGTVEVVGSTSVTPVAQKLGEAFMREHEEVKINVQGIGSTAGVKAANDKTADVGMASRNLKEGEKEWGLDEHVIAYDGIAVVAHPSNKVSDLDKESVTKIFKGEITNWKEVGGEDKEIVVVSREAGSGTRGAFEGIMNLEEENDKGKDVSAVTKDALIAEGNGAVRANIAKKENAIGYISLAYMNDTVKGIKIGGTEPTVENIVAGDYKVSRPFLMLTKGETSEVVKGYLDFIMSEEGQKIVSEKLISVK